MIGFSLLVIIIQEHDQLRAIPYGLCYDKAKNHILQRDTLSTLQRLSWDQDQRLTECILVEGFLCLLTLTAHLRRHSSTI